MIVGADDVGVVLLPEVHGAVLIPDYRFAVPHGLASQFRQGRGKGVLVSHRREREGHACHLSDEPSPYTGGAHHEIGLDSPIGGTNGTHSAVYHVDARDGGVAVEGGASGLLSAAAHFGGQVPCASVAVARGVHRAVDFVGEKGDHFAGLVGAEQVGLDAPRPTRADFSLQVLEAFRRPRDLKAADSIPQRLSSSRIEALK